MGYKYLNLDYLNSQIPDMPEEVKGLLELSVENIKGIIDELKENLDGKNWSGVYSSIHQLKSNFRILGMNELADEIEEIGQDAKHQINLDTIIDRANEVLQRWEDALIEIDEELAK